MNNHVTKAYYKPISIEKQACKLEDPICLQSPTEIVLNLRDNYPPSRLRVVEVIMGLAYVCRFIFPSLDYIAAKAGVSKRTVINCLQDLEGAGYISSAQRYNKSSIYKHAAALKDEAVLRGLWPVSKLFGALYLAFVCATPPAMATPKPPVSQVQSDSCHLRNNLFINPPSVTQSHDYITGTETKPYDYIQDTSKLKTAKGHDRRRSMVEHGGISQVIRDIKFLKLTKWGQIKASAFPDGAILYAGEQYKKLKVKPRDGFAWFFTVCDRWCQIHNIEPNWKYLEELKERHHMPDGARMTFDTPDDQPFSAKGTGTGTGIKKETGSKGEGVPSPRQPYVIPTKPEKTRDELLYDARNYLFPPKGEGMASDATEGLAKEALIAIANEHPDLIVEAQRLGPLRTQSSEEAQARTDARLASKGIRKIDYSVHRAPPPKPRDRVAEYTTQGGAPYEYKYKISPQKTQDSAPQASREPSKDALDLIARLTGNLTQDGANLTQEESYSKFDAEDGHDQD